MVGECEASVADGLMGSAFGIWPESWIYGGRMLTARCPLLKCQVGDIPFDFKTQIVQLIL